MTTNSHNRRSESTIYFIGWIVVAALIILDIMHTRYSEGRPLFDSMIAMHLCVSLVPILILFLINNYILIPSMLLKPDRWSRYFIMLGLLIFIVLACQISLPEFTKPPCPPKPLPHPHRARPIFTLPYFVSFIYDILVAGINIAVALLFHQYRSRLDKESKMKIQAQHQLSYLKHQISPHFYMNMLNNIHGMIEINPEKAQDMVMDMSKLMRYLLYESSQEFVPLQSEIDFLSNYLRLMRIRYPENKVKISVEFPDPADIAAFKVPPLIYIGYVENAFKHGVSYRGESFVALRISRFANELLFSCSNSIHPESASADSTSNSGIGLSNTSERLKLIYGSDFNLDINATATTYTISLTIPIECDKHLSSQ